MIPVVQEQCILQDQYIQVASDNIRYWCLGNKGSTLILLHGGGNCIEYWQDNILALAAHHRVYAFDMVGAGRSDKPASHDYFIGSGAEVLRAFMDALSIEKATVIGSSAGGAIALKLALTYPERLNKLVLVSSVGMSRKLPTLFRLALMPGLGEFLTRPSRKSAVMLTKQTMYNPTTVRPEYVELLYEMSILPGAHKAKLEALRQNADLCGWKAELINPIVNNLSKITKPTLIIWGKQDRIVPVESAYIAAQKIPNACLHIFDGCGHWASIEKAQEFNQLVLEFDCA
ncbi:MAG: alpha/beta hydrolase [Nostoc sp.]|uniref:alpha/beta fold hydrolase n=1 Tax=Nostoc sp. TaxID=1180 RepID=UPI002FEFFD45